MCPTAYSWASWVSSSRHNLCGKEECAQKALRNFKQVFKELSSSERLKALSVNKWLVDQQLEIIPCTFWNLLLTQWLHNNGCGKNCEFCANSLLGYPWWCKREVLKHVFRSYKHLALLHQPRARPPAQQGRHLAVLSLIWYRTWDFALPCCHSGAFQEHRIHLSECTRELLFTQ